MIFTGMGVDLESRLKSENEILWPACTPKKVCIQHADNETLIHAIL